MILTSDLVLRIIVSRACLLYSLSEVRNSKFGVWMHLWIAECHVPFLGHCASFRIIMSRAYLLYYLRYESQIC